jgi:hypothetical protein
MRNLRFFDQPDKQTIDKNFQQLEKLKAMMVLIKDELGEGYFLSPCGYYICSDEVGYLAKINIYSCEIAVSNFQIENCGGSMHVRKDNRPKTIKEAVNLIKRANKIHSQYYKMLDDKQAKIDELKKFIETLAIKKFVYFDEEFDCFSFNIQNLNKEKIEKLNNLVPQILELIK